MDYINWLAIKPCYCTKAALAPWSQFNSELLLSKNNGMSANLCQWFKRILLQHVSAVSGLPMPEQLAHLLSLHSRNRRATRTHSRHCPEAPASAAGWEASIEGQSWDQSLPSCLWALEAASSVLLVCYVCVPNPSGKFYPAKPLSQRNL